MIFRFLRGAPCYAVISVACLVSCSGASEPVEPSPPPDPEPVAEAVVAPVVAFAVPVREAKTPVPVPETPELTKARDDLAAVCRAYGVDPQNPWALDHAMLAFGADLKLDDGRDVVDFLFAEYAQPVTVGGETLLEFPEKRDVPGQKEPIRIEPHGDLLLKAFTEAGIDPARKVMVRDREHTVADLYRHSLWKAWVEGDRVWTSSWNDTPWTLQGLAAWAPPDLAWTAEGGRAMTMDGLTHAVVSQLHDETQFLRDALAKGEAVKKQKQGIFAYTCGGAHLIQGAAFAVGRGFGDDADRASIEAEVPALFYRYDAEMKAVDDGIRQYPEYRAILLSQRLKFTGHFLETTHKLAAMGLFTPTPEQQETMKRATADVVATALILEKVGMWEQLGGLKGGEQHQMFLDFVGDSCHAVRGLDLATGKGTVVY